MFSDALKQLLDEFARSGVRELHIRKADFELYLSTDSTSGRSGRASPSASAEEFSAHLTATVAPQAPVTVPALLPEQTSISALPTGTAVVSAPNLGVFYRAPKPGTANYIEVGSKVKAGDDLCLIEVMKLFTAVRADTDGVIHSVLVEDGAMVEGGQPLFALTRD